MRSTDILGKLAVGLGALALFGFGAYLLYQVINDQTDDPEIPYFRRMTAEARKVSGPYVVPGTSRHRIQRVTLSDGRAEYIE